MVPVVKRAGGDDLVKIDPFHGWHGRFASAAEGLGGKSGEAYEHKKEIAKGRKSLRVCPRSFLFLTKFSEHEAD